MSKWKYATLSEDEKIKRIGEGDKDLYESEIKNARAYQSLLKDNGVDTARADRYITRLNEAAKIPTFGTASSSDTKSKDDEKPKYLQGEKNDSMLYILDELEKAYNSYTSKRESLKEEAGKARGAVLEKLHADGYSAD